ncbi:oxidation resistance protein 1-like isoform X2 [Pecten maximus]|uniref:oxidation resistance protein 1-like isoform X2 n=1 Tax=Pecten maximus TaxID=6579 RepID=UPI0014586953|nr:oxidation resistance protein 1-like isoform X2 [Pecten maximus]
MTTKRPSFKERAFEKLGFSPRFRSNTESSTGDDNSKTTWYTHSLDHDPDSESEVTDSSGAGNSGPVSVSSNEDNMSVAAQKVPDKKPKKMKPDGTDEYSVKDSDTLESIAAFFDTTPSELKKLNRLTSRLIFPGQVLYVPKPEETVEDVNLPPSSPKGTAAAAVMEHRPCMDIPLVKMGDKPPAKIPGHIERQTSTTSPIHDESPQKLSEEEAKQLDQECHERFIKVGVKHITDGQGVVSGVLLVTPNAVMFDPNVSDPLVLEHGAERYGVIAPMDMIVSAAMYHDIAAMSIHGEKGVTKDAPKPEIYHDLSCPLYKSWVEGHAELMKQDPKAYIVKVGTPSRSATINSEMSETGSLCSCGQGVNAPGLSPGSQSAGGLSPGKNGVSPGSTGGLSPGKNGVSPGSTGGLSPVGRNGLSPGSQNESGLSPVSQTRSSTSPVNQKLSPSMEKPKEDDVMLLDLDIKTVTDSVTQGAKGEKGRSTSMDEFGEFISADPFESNQSENKDLSHDKLDEADNSNQTASVTEEESSSVLTHSNSSPSRGGKSSNQELMDGNNDDANSFHLENTMAVERVLSAQRDVVSENNENAENDSTMEQIGNIVYLPVSEDQQGEITLTDVETAQDRLSKISVDKFEQEDKSVSEPMDVPGSNKVSSADVRQSGSFGSFNVSPHLSAFVNYATGLFKTNAEVKDIADVMSEMDTQGEEGAERNAQLDNNGHKCAVKSGLEVENAIKLTDKPELFQSFDELIPKPAATFDDLPLYLCLRLGMPINKEISQTCPIQAYGKGRKKPEYWFSIPREKVDHLYAFFVQWTPQIYGGEDDIAEKRGFIVLNEEGDEEEDKLEMMDEYFSNGMLQKDWERLDPEEFWIISADEMVNRRKSACEPEVLPELVGQSKIMEEKHIFMLNRMLPPRTIGYPWMMIYSTEQHGFSLRTLYRDMQGIDSPILLVVHDTSDNIFGAVTSQALKMSDHFYGTGESFLYTFYPEFKVFHWTGDNDFFLKGNAESLFIGAGQGNFGLWFDGDIYHGRTQHCETYDNDILTCSEDFVVKTLEAWAFFSD